MTYIANGIPPNNENWRFISNLQLCAICNSTNKHNEMAYDGHLNREL